jgi:hypothetical protein
MTLNCIPQCKCASSICFPHSNQSPTTAMWSMSHLPAPHCVNTQLLPYVSASNLVLYVSTFQLVSVVSYTGVPGGKVNILGDHTTGHSKKKRLWEHVLFWTVSEIELFECTVAKLLIRKRYYILFLILIVQVTNLLVCNTFSKIPPYTSMHFATRVRTWRVACLSSS